MGNMWKNYGAVICSSAIETARGGASAAVGKVANTTPVLFQYDFIIESESGERRMKRRRKRKKKYDKYF